MRKPSFNSFLALAFAGMCAVSARDSRAGEEAPCADGHCAPKAHAKFTKPGCPIHTAEYAGDLHPAPVPEGSCHDGSAPRYHSPIEAWLSGDKCARTYSPDYGWSRPVKRPVLNRIPVQYYRMDPDYWYGDPRAFEGAYQFPTVYMPTDTTQLGFTYARVPTWQPNPAMLPAPPWPSIYHRRECPGYTPPELPGSSGEPCISCRKKCKPGCDTCPHCGQVHPAGPNSAPATGPEAPNAPPPTPVEKAAPKAVEKSAVRMIPNGLSRH